MQLSIAFKRNETIAFAEMGSDKRVKLNHLIEYDTLFLSIRKVQGPFQKRVKLAGKSIYCGVLTNIKVTEGQ